MNRSITFCNFVGSGKPTHLPPMSGQGATHLGKFLRFYISETKWNRGRPFNVKKFRLIRAFQNKILKILTQWNPPIIVELTLYFGGE